MESLPWSQKNERDLKITSSLPGCASIAVLAVGPIGEGTANISKSSLFDKLNQQNTSCSGSSTCSVGFEGIARSTTDVIPPSSHPPWWHSCGSSTDVMTKSSLCGRH